MSEQSESKGLVQIANQLNALRGNTETSAGSHTTRAHAAKSDNIIIWRFMLLFFNSF